MHKVLAFMFLLVYFAKDDMSVSETFMRLLTGMILNLFDYDTIIIQKQVLDMPN